MFLVAKNMVQLANYARKLIMPAIQHVKSVNITKRHVLVIMGKTENKSVFRMRGKSPCTDEA